MFDGPFGGSRCHVLEIGHRNLSATCGVMVDWLVLRPSHTRETNIMYNLFKVEVLLVEPEPKRFTKNSTLQKKHVMGIRNFTYNNLIFFVGESHFDRCFR